MRRRHDERTARILGRRFDLIRGREQYEDKRYDDELGCWVYYGVLEERGGVPRAFPKRAPFACGCRKGRGCKVGERGDRPRYRGDRVTWAEQVAEWYGV